MCNDIYLQLQTCNWLSQYIGIWFIYKSHIVRNSKIIIIKGVCCRIRYLHIYLFDFKLYAYWKTVVQRISNRSVKNWSKKVLVQNFVLFLDFVLPIKKIVICLVVTYLLEGMSQPGNYLPPMGRNNNLVVIKG